MLNKELFIQELHRSSSQLFSHNAATAALSYVLWAKLDECMPFHEHLKRRALEVQLSKPLHSRFTQTFPVSDQLKHYQVLAVDGSQVYPDRHIAALSCYLINIGGCYFSYGSTSNVQFFSLPSIHTSLEREDGMPLAPDVVDAHREALEYSVAYEKASDFFDQERPRFVLFDGTLFLWHLEYKAPEVKERFINHHLAILQQCKQKRIPVAGYISLTKSKELVHLIKEGVSSLDDGVRTVNSELFDELEEIFVNNDNLTDAHLLQEVLQPYERTAVFISASRISSWYPSWLKPCFFYMNMGQEIARIEIPAWLVDEEGMVEMIASLCVDQSTKGMGYPVALAEAHEQAVIKSPDRDFFYHMVFKMGIAQQQPITFSQKSIKKRGMSI